MAGIPIVSDVLNGLGTQAAGEEQRKGLNAAMGQLKTGAQNASGFQQPIYNQSLQNFQNLSKQNANGQFNMPTSQQVPGGNFQMGDFKADPGYQFSLNQGLDQIKGQAAQGGMAHSPQTTKALMDYGIGRGAQEYGDIYNRQQNTYNTNTNQQLATQGQQWNQNFANNNAQFGRGMQLNSFLPGAANNLSDIQTGLYGNLANIEQSKGAISGQLAANPFIAGGSAINSLPGAVSGIQDLYKQYQMGNQY